MERQWSLLVRELGLAVESKKFEGAAQGPRLLCFGAARIGKGRERAAATEGVAAWTGECARPHTKSHEHCYYAAAGWSPDLCSHPARLCSRTGVPNIAREKKRSLSAVPRKNGIPAV
jgi:hypothetical protein